MGSTAVLGAGVGNDDVATGVALADGGTRLSGTSRRGAGVGCGFGRATGVAVAAGMATVGVAAGVGAVVGAATGWSLSIGPETLVDGVDVAGGRRKSVTGWACSAAVPITDKKTDSAPDKRTAAVNVRDLRDCPAMLGPCYSAQALNGR